MAPDTDTSALREQQFAWLRLSRVPGVDATRARLLVAEAGSPMAALEALPGCARILPAHCERLAIERDLDWLAGGRHCLLTACDPRYPPQLAATPGAPAALFVDGTPGLLRMPQVAIVGSRSATAAGREAAFEFAARLSVVGLVVTSGLAAGIDAAAHCGALAAGRPTIAVCGTGLDRVYPRVHTALAARIAATGALVSEFGTGTPPRAGNFPRRNRVLSGLALGVVVIEAARRSGSLITARLAGEQGRDVMALPGSIHNPLAKGCHRLIRDGAALVECAEDVLEVLGFEPLPAHGKDRDGTVKTAEVPAPGLDSAGEMLLNALGFEPADADTLVARTGLEAHQVGGLLQLLELGDRVESLPGGRYCRLPPRQVR